MKVIGVVAVCVLLVGGGAPQVHAQSGEGQTDAAEAEYVPLPLTPAAERLDIWPDQRSAPGLLPPDAYAFQQDRRGGVTWLVVGASLIGAGMLIDGDAGTAVSVTGALLGAYGVYLMVRR